MAVRALSAAAGAASTSATPPQEEVVALGPSSPGTATPPTTFASPEPESEPTAGGGTLSPVTPNSEAGDLQETLSPAGGADPSRGPADLEQAFLAALDADI